MSRKFALILAILFLILIGSALYDLPVIAAPQRQEGNQPERERPGMDSYHGKEEIPYMPGIALPEVDGKAVASPVEGWSKMAFRSYLMNEDEFEIYSASGSFSNLVRLTYGGGYDSSPRLNRGGTRIVFFSDRGGDQYDIYAVNPDGSNLTRLTNSAADDARPVWSPDGTHIAFQSYRDGNAEIYLMHPDGSGLTRLTNNTIYDGEPTWSPDGSKIAFTSYRDQLWRIWVMNADGSNQVRLSDQAYSELPVWSPDGGRIAFDADDDYDDMMELWVMNADGSNESVAVNSWGDQSLWANGWSPDGKYVTYTDVRMVYYDPYWYWYAAYLYKHEFYGWPTQINPGRDTDFYLDWTTTDITPPTVSMDPLPPESIDYFYIFWSGWDGVSGLKNYDVQVRDGANGAWTDLAMGIQETNYFFTNALGGHDYYFRVRGRDNAFNLTPWPANPQAHTHVEGAAPTSRILPVEALTRGSTVTLRWEGYDQGGSGLQYYDIQYMDGAVGVWVDWLMNVWDTSAVFTGQLGHTYHFRSRATDFAKNVEAWPADDDTYTTMFSWLTAGKATDHTGTPVIGMNVTVDPAAFSSYPSDEQGNYKAYVGTEQESKIVTWSKSEYGWLPATRFGIPDAYVDVVLPPANNAINDPYFESGGYASEWQVDGEYPPTITSTVSHSGDFAASLGEPPYLGNEVVISSVNPHTIPVYFPDHQGGLHVAWTEGQTYYNPHQFYYMHRLPDGTWLSPEMVLQTDIYENRKLVTIAVDADSNVHMLMGADSLVYYAVRDPLGGWSVPLWQFSDAYLIGMAIDDASTLHAVIRQSGWVKYARMEPGGEWQIESLLESDNVPSIKFAINPSGSVSIGWISYTNSQAIIMQRSVDGTWSDPTKITYPGLATIDIVIDSTGVTHIILGENYPLGGLAYTALYPDGSWTPPRALLGAAWYPTLLIDPHNTLYLLTPDEQTDTEEIMFMEKPADGEWTYPLMISNPGNRDIVMQGTVSPSGDVLVTWWELDTWKKFYNWRHAGVWSGVIQIGGDEEYVETPSAAFDEQDGLIMGWHQWGDTPGYHYLRTHKATMNGDSTLSQSFTVPPSMTNPTLSFLASLSGVSPISGNEFSVQVTDAITTTTLFTSTTPSGPWEHFWFDMSYWSGEQITLTFQVTEHAGFPPAQLLLDEVTLGAAHPDVWVDLSSPPRYADPGDTLDLELDYGNRGTVLAESSTITFTLPAGVSFVEASIPPDIVGTQLVWQLGELAGKSEGSITLTLQVDADAVLGQEVALEAVITTTSEEIEVINNQVERVVFLGYAGILPIIRR